MNTKLPTLRSLNYDGNPPRCGNCTKRFVARISRGKTPDSGKKFNQLMCALAQHEVKPRGVCDSWTGFNGDELEPT